MCVSTTNTIVDTIETVGSWGSYVCVVLWRYKNFNSINYSGLFYILSAVFFKAMTLFLFPEGKTWKINFSDKWIKTKEKLVFSPTVFMCWLFSWPLCFETTSALQTLEKSKNRQHCGY